MPAWEAITQDAFVLSIIRGGYQIHLAVPLPNGVLRLPTPRMNGQSKRNIRAEISALLNKGVIERVKDHPHLCLSPVFIVPKRSGKLRMILNLKKINLHIDSVGFKMETLSSILPLLRPGDWAVSLDLRDAYHHVPIAARSRDLLGFSFDGQAYRYRALPFGLKPAPRLFTRVVSCVAAFVRQQGLRLFCYLDDWLLVANSRELLMVQLEFLLKTVQELGFIINWEKSKLTPTQGPLFLGASLDIPRQLARPSPQRVDTIIAAAGALRRKRHATARRWLQFLGYLASLVDVLPDCRLHMRPLQLHFLSHFRPNRDSLLLPVPVPHTIRVLLLQWQKRSFLCQGNPFSIPQPSVTVTTDASLLGWGGHCRDMTVAGDWSHLDRTPHINVLEFLAVSLSIQHFKECLHHRTVLIQTDNVTVTAYINKQGGTHSPRLNDLAAQFWRWCRRNDIVPVASHIAGQDNLIADFLSRGRSLPSEWMLHPQIVSRIVQVMGPLTVDLFASALNHRLPRYCSRVRDPAAWAIDAFSLNWGTIAGYAFPPIALIPRLLRKVREDQASVVLIAPWWPKRPWFLDLISLLAGLPRVLPDRPDLIRQPISEIPHPRPLSLALTAWPLSGSLPVRQAFLHGPLTLSHTATGIPPGRRTIPVWRDSFNGASLVTLIPVLPL